MSLLPRLRRFARWLTRDASRADDLVQATLERALTRWGSRRDDTALRTWLFAIAYRQFLDDQSRARRHARLLELLDRTRPPNRRWWNAKLSPSQYSTGHGTTADEQRHLLLWVSVEGLSYREVANLLVGRHKHD